MSKNTFFNTRFWQDSYIADLDPSEKLLFNYCLTSPFLSMSGIYEVPLKYIAIETGIDKDMVSKILARFEQDNKIVYYDGWLCILKYPKYQSYNLPNVKKGLDSELKSIPAEIMDHFINSGYAMEDITKTLARDWQGIDTMVMDKEQGKDNGNGKEKYGESGAVLMTPEEYLTLVELIGEPMTKSLIEELDDYMGASGKKYKSHYKALRNWARRKIQDHAKTVKNNNTTKRIII